MATSLTEEFKKHREPSKEGEDFLNQLEKGIDQDLWKSAGGYWSSASIEIFRSTAMIQLAQTLEGDSLANYQKAWAEVVRDFHKNTWGEKRLEKKEKKPETEEDRTFWELFSYIWILCQAVFVVKTTIFYFGIKSAQEDNSEGRIWLLLAILFSFVSLSWFAYRKSKQKKEK